MDRDIFTEELMEIYGEIFHNVDGVVITGIYPVKQEQKGNTTDFYFDVNVLQKGNQNMKPVITKKLQSDDGMSQVLNRVQKYTDEEGRELKWCITDDGQYSTESCVAAPSKWYDMPVWKIITITAASVVLIFGICISLCVIVRRRAIDAKEVKSKTRECRKGQHYRDDERGRKQKKRHHSKSRHSRPYARREERRYHRHHRQPCREATRHRRQYSGETLSDFDNDVPPRCLVTHVPLQHQRQKQGKLQVEPWQQSKLPRREQDEVDVEECHRQRSYPVYHAAHNEAAA